jgi:hypothetical protein
MINVSVSRIGLSGKISNMCQLYKASMMGNFAKKAKRVDYYEPNVYVTIM